MTLQRASDTIDLAAEPAFTLGSLQVTPAAREVRGRGRQEVLEPRVMQVLVALAKHRGEVVSKDRLIELCWAGRVVGDDAIGRCTAKLRRIAEDLGGFSIDTIARVGYRLIEESTVGTDVPTSVATHPQTTKRAGVAWLTAIVVACVALLGVWQWNARQAVRAEDARLLAEAESLVRQDRYGAAFLRLQQVRMKDDPTAIDLWNRSVAPLQLNIAEAGAIVAFAPYEEESAEWTAAGTSPFERPVDAPVGTLRIKVEKPGFRTAYFTLRNRAMIERIADSLSNSEPPLPLAPANAPEQFVLVPQTSIPVFVAGWTTSTFGGARYDIPQFAIAQFEVTNREFKEFVDAGGYVDPKYWEGLQFVDGNRELSWSEAQALFVDSTGRPGPAGWRLSSYSAEAADFPVGGISWYEAVAYARFRHAMLPTVHHWVRAAMGPSEAQRPIVPSIAIASRFSSDGPVSARSMRGLGPWGTYHMLGNVREWVWNRAGNDALALGGGWSDYYSDSQVMFAASPMSRALENGVRLMQPPTDPLAPQLLEPITRVQGKIREPVSDAAFEAMRFQFTIQHTPPTSVRVTELERTSLAIAEEVTLEFAQLPPLVMYIVRLPASTVRAQAIIYGPPANCCFTKRSNRDVLGDSKIIRFIVDSGRALVVPIWAGSYDSFVPPDPDPAVMADRQRRVAVRWQQELSSTLDYLATRDDLEPEGVGFLGFSMGAIYMGSINLALEPRVKAAVLVSAGASYYGPPPHPMIDIVNYAPRVTIPVLMINGRFDHIFPYEQSQKRLFELLGTPAEQKRHLVLETSHFGIAPNQIILNTTEWFDRYLGAAR